MAGGTTTDRWRARQGGIANASRAWMAGFARPARGFVSQPEPRMMGSYARGRQLVAGNLLFAGSLVEAPSVPVWDVTPPDDAFLAEIHGASWLDDLAAAGHPRARPVAQEWVWGWIERYGSGRGPGWLPELAALRLIRWINHATFLLHGRDAKAQRRFYRSLAQQTVYLSRSWQDTVPGLPRFQALTGLICAGLALIGMERRAEPAIAALAAECEEGVDHGGGIATRNPEELMEILTLLTWAVAALDEAGRTVPRGISQAVERIVPTLRALRHSDGGLARFHGGGRGAEGRLDAALAAAAVRAQPAHGGAMGYARLTGGRTSVIIDAALPPGGGAALSAHASSLAFELTSGRRPLIVNCGSGTAFGEQWRRAGRATPSHSALCIDGVSSARLGRRQLLGGRVGEPLIEGPGEVWSERGESEGEHRLSLTHDAWVPGYGLTCYRELALTADGRALGGEDMLAAMSADERQAFDMAMDKVRLGGIAFSIRFHLHPDADPEIDLGGTAVSIALRSGEIWVFRHDGGAELSLEPSVYLEKGRLKPRATQQIVLSSRVMNYSGRVSWTLAKAVDTPSNLRDTEMAELALDGPEI